MLRHSNSHKMAAEDSPRVEHVSVKAPEFIETAPRAWFSILEAQFELRAISKSSTKYFNALSSLPASVVARIPPSIFESQCYDTLKNSIVSSHEKSKPELFEKMLSKATYSGRPSAYLQEICSISQKLNIGDDLIRHKFIQSLPSPISAVIAAQGALDLDALGKLADNLVPYFSDSTVNAVQRQQPPSVPNTGYSDHNSRHSPNRARSRSPSSNNHIPFGLRPFNENQRPKICRGHIYFGDTARSCKPWCHWPDKSNVNILPASRPSSRSSSPVNNYSTN